MILFLDDDENRHNVFKKIVPGADRVFTARRCINALAYKKYDVVLLDHDLGGETFVSSDGENTGMEVVRWIEKNKPEIRTIIVHSWNTSAGPVMVSRLQSAGYNAFYIPFQPAALRKLMTYE